MNHFGRNQKDQSWRIICDRREAEDLWNKLNRIHQDKPCLFSKQPFINNKPGFKSAVIYCNVNSMDEAKIRKSAEFIRKKIFYPFAMLCFEFDRNSTGNRKISFLHTPDGELYIDNGEELELIPLNPSEVPIERMVLESSKAALWPGQLPSKVTDQEYIYLPSSEEGKANLLNENGGKWMVFTSRSNMARHDDFFLAMVSLYQKGILVGLRVATAMSNPGETYQKSHKIGNAREGVTISCYTADSEDKEDVLRAAEAIRSVIQNECIINYKTNSASIKGHYHHKGIKYVTKYMHTVGGGFYERDYLERFKLVVPSTASIYKQ